MFLQRKAEKMINVFDYENKEVLLKCINGKTYEGKVKWCARAEDIDEKDDVLAIGEIGILASEIESVSIIEKTSEL